MKIGEPIIILIIALSLLCIIGKVATPEEYDKWYDQDEIQKEIKHWSDVDFVGKGAEF